MTAMIATSFIPSRSYPYMSIAKEFGLDYGLVLKLADANRAPDGTPVPKHLHSTDDEMEPFNEMLNQEPGKFEFFIYNMNDAARHYIFVQKYGFPVSNLYYLSEWVDELPVEEWPDTLPIAETANDIPF